MMDNITVDTRGEVIIQEDVGNQAHVGKVWRYNIPSGSLEMVAQHDPDRCVSGALDFLTIDEESSGVIPAFEVLGEGWYFMDAHPKSKTPGVGGRVKEERKPLNRSILDATDTATKSERFHRASDSQRNAPMN